MADEVNYVYGSMEQAVGSMQRIGSNIQSACEDMSSDAMRLLASNGGSYAEGYHIKLNKLNGDIAELNSEMTARAAQLQDLYSNMAHADRTLGDGF